MQPAIARSPKRLVSRPRTSCSCRTSSKNWTRHAKRAWPPCWSTGATTIRSRAKAMPRTATHGWNPSRPSHSPFERPSRSGVDLFSTRHHVHEFLRPRFACFGLFRRLYAPAERIAVGAIQLFEKPLSPGIRGQCIGQLRWDLHPAGTFVRSVPASICLGRLDFAHARRLHPSGRDQLFDLVDIDLRPDTARSPRREAEQVEPL